MVATTRDAFGLVEGRAIDKKDWVAERLQAPVSMEKMQVLSNVALWERFVAEVKGPPDSVPRLSRVTDDLTKNYFAQAVVHAGPTGSGTRQMQSYLLNAAGVQSKRTLSGDFDAEVEAVRSGNVAVAFIFSEPLQVVADAISDGSAVRLAAIDPSLVPILFRELGFSPEPTTLVRGKAQAVETIGAYAWLVASKDVPPEDVAKVVHRIVTCKTQAAAKASPWEETFSNGCSATAQKGSS